MTPDNHSELLSKYTLQVGDYVVVRESFYAYGYWHKVADKKTGLESWHFVDETHRFGYTYEYAIGHPHPRVKHGRSSGTLGWYKRPSIHMPDVAARVMLEVTEVRLEQLQDISEADAVAEGVDMRIPAYYELGSLVNLYDHNADIRAFADVLDGRAQYAFLINEINGSGTWEHNPWMFATTFKILN